MTYHLVQTFGHPMPQGIIPMICGDLTKGGFAFSPTNRQAGWRRRLTHCRSLCKPFLDWKQSPLWGRRMCMQMVDRKRSLSVSVFLGWSFLQHTPCHAQAGRLSRTHTQALPLVFHLFIYCPSLSFCNKSWKENIYFEIWRRFWHATQQVGNFCTLS